MRKTCSRCNLEIEDSMGIFCCPFCGTELEIGKTRATRGIVVNC